LSSRPGVEHDARSVPARKPRFGVRGGSPKSAALSSDTLAFANRLVRAVIEESIANQRLICGSLPVSALSLRLVA
jgi:hypothetical protein